MYSQVPSTFTAGMTKIVYDIEGDDKIARQMALVEDAQEGIAQGLVPGRFLVQFLPFLRYMPAWLPGAGFKRLSNKWRAAARSAKYVPFEEVKRALVSRVHVVRWQEQSSLTLAE